MSVCVKFDTLLREALQVLAERLGMLVVEQLKDEDPHQTWEVVDTQHETGARPATSCHLTYHLPGELLNSTTWTLQCTVTPELSHPATYFCVVGWGPGGYSGIQEVEVGHRVAIFSMWNDGNRSVEEICHGPGVKVETFGGEGTGLKSMMDFP